MPSSYILRPPRASSPMYALPLGRLRDILVQVVPGSTLTSVEEIPSTRLPRFYNLNFSDSTQLLLSYAPPLSVRLLRDEHTLLQSEAMLLRLLVAMLRPDVLGDVPSTTGQTGHSYPGDRVRNIIPTLLKHSTNPREIYYPYNIFKPVVGVPLSTMLTHLNIRERQSIDKQIGELVRDLALITSPNGTFGGVARVCADHTRGSPGGSPGWTEAFMSLVEGILRDGEDMSVLLPYALIRQHFTRLAWRLSAVTIPRLIVIDAGDESNMMIVRTFDDKISSPENNVRISGLRDWSQGVFGDPLLAICFENPSPAFLSGWRSDVEQNLIEDENGSNTRMLLYKCYRAIVNVVTEYYRPQADSSTRELEARRRLTTVLADLEKVDMEPSKVTKRTRIENETQEADKRRKLDESGNRLS